MNALRTLAALTATLGFAACEISSGDLFPNDGPPAGETAPPPTYEDPYDPNTYDPDPPADPTEAADDSYYAVFIEDLWNNRCASSSVGAHGADIDAVGLWDPSGNPAAPELISWLEFIDVEFDPTQCDRYGYGDGDLSLGEPDGSLIEGFHSLAGGWMIGEFASQVAIDEGLTLTIHEIDDDYCMGITNCIGDERYDVYLATDLDCPNTGPDFRETCMVKLTGDEGALGSATLPIRRYTLDK